jgi:hypothetical protein
MSENHSAFSRFYFTGQMSGENLFDIGTLGLHPALFNGYEDLSTLRYDFPLVLFKGGNGTPALRSLSDITDEILREIAPQGIDGERLRRHVLALECEIRTLARDENKETLFELWERAEDTLRARFANTDDVSALDDSLKAARDVLKTDGEIIDYKDDTPRKVLTHAWSVVQENKSRVFRQRIEELTLRLSNILKGDSMKSAAAFEPDALKKSIGSSYESEFDFESMSDILGTAFVTGALPKKRWQRIRSVLSTLKSQKFFPPMTGNRAKKKRKENPAYVFDHCAPAIEAFRRQLPKMVKLVKAITIADLELEGRYKESTHDQFFKQFDERYLEADDLAMFPTYLICLRKGDDAKAEKADLVEVLSSGLPFKVLLQNHDIVEELSIASGQFSFGVRGSQLASLALGLDGVFVLQASGAELYRMNGSVLDGLTHSGPSLFNIFSGRTGPSTHSAKNVPELPLYLRAAAATESRAFPVFVHDPTGGREWVSRVSLVGNPQPGLEWPMHRFEYEDEDLQRVSQDIAFTFADFAALDERYADSFAGVARPQWRDNMVPVDEFLEMDDKAAADRVPYVLMVDNDNVLHRAIVEVRLIQAAKRCREMWRNLGELSGIGGPNAITPEVAPNEAPGEILPPAAETVSQPEQITEEERPPPPPGEPYIETPRCTTCEECIKINKRMFAYDDNRQAYIADLKAGTYKHLVEAAENCQVAIIHPGVPVNTDEPNIDGLIARAELFN